jgi:hypothetical protein
MNYSLLAVVLSLSLRSLGSQRLFGRIGGSWPVNIDHSVFAIFSRQSLFVQAMVPSLALVTQRSDADNRNRRSVVLACLGG